jgi:hypothetical protein
MCWRRWQHPVAYTTPLRAAVLVCNHVLQDTQVMLLHNTAVKQRFPQAVEGAVHLILFPALLKTLRQLCSLCSLCLCLCQYSPCLWCAAPFPPTAHLMECTTSLLMLRRAAAEKAMRWPSEVTRLRSELSLRWRWRCCAFWLQA